MEKLEKSERMVAAILSVVSQRGVLKEELSLKQVDPDGTLGADGKLFYDAIEWLSKEGILTFQWGPMTGRSEVEDIVLTSYGFSVLGKPFGSPGNQETLRDAADRISNSNVSYSSIGDFLGSFLGGFTKSIGS